MSFYTFCQYCSETNADFTSKYHKLATPTKPCKPYHIVRCEHYKFKTFDFKQNYRHSIGQFWVSRPRL